MKSKLTNEDKNNIIRDLNKTIGSDISNIADSYIESDVSRRKLYLESCLNIASDRDQPKLLSTIEKAQQNSIQIENLKTRSDKLKQKVEDFIKKTKPLRSELDKRFSAISRLEGVLLYMKSFEKIDELSSQMKQCNDDEQLVQLYLELKGMSDQCQKGHHAAYIKEYTYYWHNVLKDNLIKHYEEVLKLFKWPFTSSNNHPLPKDALIKFSNITKYLFLIQEPEDLIPTTYMEDLRPADHPSLVTRILLRPLKKRFTFHFSGTRQTARIDRPEWFLTQILTWIKHHRVFVQDHVQPVVEKLELKHISAVDEFNNGLISFAAERLHLVLGLYLDQRTKGEIVDVDAAFAHAVDETLGFHRELRTITGYEMNSVLYVLTRAEHFVRWIGVEKKYALAKMDEALGNEQWSEPVAAGVSVAVGFVLWVPRSADWMIALLKTIEDRYSMLPQPGHRLQFLELQLELIEEWRVRLTQLMGAALDTMQPDSFLTASSPHPLTAVVNAAHYTRTVLLQWAQSLHYLQLHFYRRQFEHFTKKQHTDMSAASSSRDSDYNVEIKEPKTAQEINEVMSLNELEFKSKMMALTEMSRRSSQMNVPRPNHDMQSTGSAKLSTTDPIPAVDPSQVEDAGVFGEASGLLTHLRDAGLAALSEHIMLEFKASIRDYKKQKWHAMLMVEEMALSVSGTLCGPLSALCARLSAADARLAPLLTARLRADLAAQLDHYMLQEIVLETWFNTGGTLQFTHDVKRNLVPAFAPPYKSAKQVNQLPKLLEACKLLNMDYEDARRLQALLSKQPAATTQTLNNQDIRHIQPKEALQILNQRTDLSDSSTPASVMELF